MIVAPLWIAVSIAWFRKPHAIAGVRGAYTITGFLWLFALIMYLAGYFFIWWDITDDALVERRLWNTKFIPWVDIYRVGLWRPLNKGLGGTLEIDYARTGPTPDRGSITLLPRERQAFLATLRTHAPQAAIEL
jgi:hypothetical protein